MAKRKPKAKRSSGELVLYRSYEQAIHRRGSQRSPTTIVATNQATFEMDDIGSYLEALEGEYGGLTTRMFKVDIQGYSSGPFALQHFLAFAADGATIITSYSLDQKVSVALNNAITGKWNFLALTPMKPARCVASNLWVARDYIDITKQMNSWYKQVNTDLVYAKIITMVSSNQLQLVDFFPRSHIIVSNEPYRGQYQMVVPNEGQ